MKIPTTPQIDNDSIIRTLSKSPKMLHRIIDIQVIWYSEWEDFAIVRLNDFYLLFELQEVIFYNSALEVVKTELIERFHHIEFTARQNSYSAINQISTIANK